MDPIVKDTFDALKRNRFDVHLVETIDEAHEKVMELIPVGATVGIGDSTSVRQLEVIPRLQTEARIVVNPFSKDISEAINTGQISLSQSHRIDCLALYCEYFLTGSNVLTRDGKLLNIDGAGNRVVGQMFGPEHVVLVIGTNKIVEDLAAGYERMRNVISPQHAKIKNRKTPCAITEKCEDCTSPERICNVTGIIEKNPGMTDIHIVLVNEDLGLGWEWDWPEERVKDVYETYAELTYLKRPDWRKEQ